MVFTMELTSSEILDILDVKKLLYQQLDKHYHLV